MASAPHTLFQQPSRRTGRCLAAVALVFALSGLGCTQTKPKPSLGSASAATLPAAPVIVTADLSSLSAFDLVALPDGLRLVWASAAPAAGWLFEAELGHDGKPRSSPRRLAMPARALGKVTDLSASELFGQIALAWLEQAPGEARAVASFVSGTDEPKLIDLGPAAISAESARGNLALVAAPEQQRALVMWRGLAAPCVSPESAPCVGFLFRRFTQSGAQASDMPLSVPVPCASHSVQLVTSAGRLHYGVCTREGSDPVTTMFSIRYEPPYARAEPLLKGCLPLGTVVASGAPWLVADCHGKRRAVPVPLGDEKVEGQALDALEARCTPERAELRQGRFVLTLREPRAGLQTLLPASWLPSGARAGWTGKSLVIVYESAGRLATRTLACREGWLVPG
jgi:hypothetical protein